MMPMKPFHFKLKDVSESTGLFSGYASTFDDQPDAYGDVVARGAFSASLKRHQANGTRVAMLWSHDPNEPIGTWESIKEDDNGLKVTGRLVLEVGKAREALALMKAGALSGLSIGFQTIDCEPRRAGGRLLKKIELWEVSLVTFPANEQARLLSVNAADIKTIRDFESLLTDVGFSRLRARHLAQAWKALPASGERDARTQASSKLIAGLKAYATLLEKSEERRNEKQLRNTASKP